MISLCGSNRLTILPGNWVIPAYEEDEHSLYLRFHSGEVYRQEIPWLTHSVLSYCLWVNQSFTDQVDLRLGAGNRLDASFSTVARSTIERAIWLESGAAFRLAGFLALGRFDIGMVC